MERGWPQRLANPDQEGSHRNLPAGPCGSRRRTRAARRLRCFTIFDQSSEFRVWSAGRASS